MTQPGAHGRVWLDVPYAEKDEAKAAGARWDAAARRWFAPRAEMPGMERWAAIPDVLPGEDRSFGAGLFVDLVPSSCWFTNVRSCVDVRDWDRLRRRVYGRAGQRCEVCGAEPDRDRDVRLEAHERWDFLEAPRVQKLIRLICLCNQCHEVTHVGFAQVQGTDQRALAHLMTVGGLSRRQAEEHVQRAFRTWEARSRATWTLDLSMLTEAGVRIVEPPSPGQRREASRDMLARETSAQTSASANDEHNGKSGGSGRSDARATVNPRLVRRVVDRRGRADLLQPP